MNENRVPLPNDRALDYQEESLYSISFPFDSKVQRNKSDESHDDHLATTKLIPGGTIVFVVFVVFVLVVVVDVNLQITQSSLLLLLWKSSLRLSSDVSSSHRNFFFFFFGVFRYSLGTCPALDTRLRACLVGHNA